MPLKASPFSSLISTSLMYNAEPVATSGVIADPDVTLIVSTSFTSDSKLFSVTIA